MSDGVLLGLDVGGGSGRCLVLEPATGRTTTATRDWRFAPAPGTSGLGFDLDLDRVWSALGEAVGEALTRAGRSATDVCGIAATSMRFGMVVLDEDGAPVFAVPNRDARAAFEGFQIAAEQGELMHATTGMWPMPIFAAARLRWLRTNDDSAFQRAHRLLSIDDWLTHRLCGALATERSQAGCTGLFSLAEREGNGNGSADPDPAAGWAWDLIDALELPRHLFPEVLAAGSRTGELSEDAARDLGLPAGCAVGVGGADTQCGLLGAGAIAAGDVAIVAGTTAPVQAVLASPTTDAGGRLWAGHHVVADRFVLESNAGPLGESLEWFARLLYPDAPRPTARLLAEAASSQPGAMGMLSSLGAEVMNARAPRMPVGQLTLAHMATPHDRATRRHLVRSVIEGQVCALRSNLEQLQVATGESFDAIHLTGGLSRSDLFGQIASDVLGRPVRVSGTHQATALGAALCAGVAAGVFADLEAAVGEQARTRVTFEPERETAGASQELFERWTKLREANTAADAVAGELATPWVLQANHVAAEATGTIVRPRILATAQLERESLERLRALGEVEYASFREVGRMLTGATLVEALQGFQVFVTEIDLVDAAAIGDLPDLRVIACCRGDAVNVDVAASTAYGVPVLNTPGRNADAVADLTLAFLLMLARKLIPANDFMRESDVQSGDMGRFGQAFNRFRGSELWHKTIGLIGLGAVGRGVAQRLSGFAAHVLVADPYVSEAQAALVGAELVALDELLARSDFVSLHAAVTDETRGMLGKSELAVMRPEAFLVNTARAALVEEAALIDALERGVLAGAALDTFAIEPPGSDHPLLALDNVIATPHLGGNTNEVAAHQGEIVVDALAALLAGETPSVVLNPEVLRDFDLRGERPRPDAETISRLRKKPGPAVTDLQRDKKAEKIDKTAADE